MFSFFKSAIEKDLIKLGFGELVQGFKQKVKNNEWTKEQFTQALKEFHSKHQSQINNLSNVNVATRQSFDVDDTIVPLNLQNIQQEFIDFDFIHSSLLFEYNNNNRIHIKALNELEKNLNQLFPDAIVLVSDQEKLQQLSVLQLINEATIDANASNKNYLKAVFKELYFRYENR